MKEVIVLTLFIIGALVGVGFASGQEMYSFFYAYGIYGIIGMIVSCSLMSIVIFKCLKLIYDRNINSYDEFLEIYIKNKKITKLINLILNILLLITFYIMIAGFGAYFEQEIGINRTIGSAILAVLTASVFFTNVKGVLKVSEYIVPLLLIFIVLIGGENLIFLDSNIVLIEVKKRWLLSSIIYCSYNMILLIPVLISIKNQLTNRKNIKYIAILCGILMSIMSIFIFMLIAKVDIDIATLEMPVVYAIGKFFSKYKILYAFIILASIFTTAISLGIGFLQNMCKNQRGYPQLVLFMCITSLIISRFGFSNLVNLLYPLFGYLGTIQIIVILFGKNARKKSEIKCALHGKKAE